ncbi:hypothetical protein BCV70DRAFT_231892 [Testicularia cyperi]|uniref:Clathrin/coatomer adaptor adaptin-like N-terminal domain-containing protein n=1 Tax=Testicularia cyperi TaxID=1882483 RepID=A0A317XQV5_9BASI|nr:hypothetical protein BCV70DRAFT_231892 [Testicularia cyperi]
MTSAYSNSSRALAFLSETSEDAIAALKGLVGGVGSAKYLDTSEDTLATIAVQIDSSRDEDRIVALTRIVAMISKGRDASQFLPAVLKLTSCSNLDVRKLVYIVLLRYANLNPDLTLLSINSFQRDLSDPSPLIRAMALRVLSSIKVSMVAPIVFMAVAKATRDPNLYVRKIAALAIPKCFQIDRSQLDTLLESLSTLLSDRSPYVLGAALSAYQQVCPDRWDLLHQQFRKICHAIADMDEWGQISSLQVLSRYARANFAKPRSDNQSAAASSEKVEIPEMAMNAATRDQASRASKQPEGNNGTQDLEDFLASDAAPSVIAAAPRSATSSSLRPSQSNYKSSATAETRMDRDLELLLFKSQALLHSQNAAVVMAALRITFYLGPQTQRHLVARPLLRILHDSTDTSYVVLRNVATIARRDPRIFAPYVTSFFLGASHQESLVVSKLKLDILVTVCTKANLGLVLPELATHIRSPQDAIAVHAVTCIGRLAGSTKLNARSKCLTALLNLLKKRKTGASVSGAVIARAVLVVKNLISDSDAPDLDGSNATATTNKTAAIVYRLAALLFGTVLKADSDGTNKSKKKTPKPKVLGKGAILHPGARASILWLLGQHARRTISITTSSGQKATKTLAELVLPDVLRRCAVNFVHEAPGVKLQILTVSSKTFAFLPTVLTGTGVFGDALDGQGRAEQLMATVTKLHFYLLKLARDSIQDAIARAARSVGETSSEDDADLKGVRLRREQVIHVLFEGKTSSFHPDTAKPDVEPTVSPETSTPTQSTTSRKEVEIGTLSLILDGKLIKGWLSTQLPDWTDTPTSPSLREPPQVTAPSHPSLTQTSLAGLKSFSSSDFASWAAGPVTLTPTTAAGSSLTPPATRSASRSGNLTPVDLEASTQQQQKYKDLDSFLDESDSEDDEQELDAVAPEDDDYMASNQEWGVQDDGDYDEEDDEEDDDDDDDADAGDDDDDDDEGEEEDADEETSSDEA